MFIALNSQYGTEMCVKYVFVIFGINRLVWIWTNYENVLICIDSGWHNKRFHLQSIRQRHELYPTGLHQLLYDVQQWQLCYTMEISNPYFSHFCYQLEQNYQSRTQVKFKHLLATLTLIIFGKCFQFKYCYCTIGTTNVLWYNSVISAVDWNLVVVNLLLWNVVHVHSDSEILYMFFQTVRCCTCPFRQLCFESSLPGYCQFRFTFVIQQSIVTIYGVVSFHLP